MLVTGASGFVGSALVSRLVARGDSVTACVRVRPAEPTPGADYLLVNDRIEAPGLAAALARTDVVIHLVARTHSADLDDPDAIGVYRRINVELTDSLARKCIASPVRRFVFLSSIKVHGERSGPQGLVESAPLQPEDAYGTSKLEAERALEARLRGSSVGYTIVRPPLVYGPGVKANFLRMIRAIDRGIPLPLASVRNLRSIIGISNLTDFIVTSMEHPSAHGEAFLVSDRERLSTPELLRAIGDVLDRPARLFPAPTPLLAALATLVGGKGVYRRLTGTLVADSGKAHRLLGWEAPISLAEGLRATVVAYRRTACD